MSDRTSASFDDEGPHPYDYLRDRLADMTAERDAALAKMAVLREALQYVDWRLYFDGSEGRYVAKDDYDGNVIDAALAQPAASEPQPVGRMEESGIIEGLIIPVVEGEFPEGTLLYAAPPAAPRTLTDAEIDAIADDMPGGMDGFLKSWGWRQFARAIARALSATPEQP